MLGIADIEKILKDKLKGTPVSVEVRYISQQEQDDMIKVEFWFPVFSFEKKWWTQYGCSFFMSGESRCIENVQLLVRDMISKYIHMMREVNPKCLR